jgi:hypothetical protein
VEHLGEAAQSDVDGSGVDAGGAFPMFVAGGQLGDPVLDLVVVALDPGDHQGPAAVVVAERGCVPLGPVRDHVVDAVLGCELGGESRAGGRHCGVVDVAVPRGDEQQHVGHARVESLGERVVGAFGFGGRVVEPAGREVIGNPATEGTGDREHQHGGDDDGPGVVRGESGEPGEHATASLGRG